MIERPPSLPAALGPCRPFAALVLCVALVPACGGDSPNEPTYHGSVRALIEAKCVACHRAGGIGPFALDDPATVAQLAPALVDAVETRQMPPWGMSADCRDVVGNIRLTDDQVATFVGWRAAGFPDGDPADYRPPDPRDVLTDDSAEDELGAPDLVLAPAEAYRPDAQRPDDYRCIPLPHEIDRDTFITALEVRPDITELVHHVIVYAVPAADVPEIEALDAADPGPGFSCFGDAGVDSSDPIGGWVPGSGAATGSPEVAMRVAAGSRLVIQMHYNVAGRDDAEIVADATGVALWTLPEGEYPDFLLTSLWIADPTIDIPAGAASSVHQATMRLPVDALAVAMSPHMHLLGRRIETELVRESGAVECLTRVEDWDFDWQRSYEFASHAYVPVDIRDQIRITCEYDNSPANQPIVNGEQLAPRDVAWGDGTFDEMCLDSLIVLTPFRGQGESGVCGGFGACFDDCAAGDPFCALSCMTGAGFSCLQCGTDGLFGPCATATCPDRSDALGLCLFTCPDIEVDPYGCMYDTCQTEMLAYYDCVEPTLRSGSCASDFADCAGIAQ